MKDEKDKMSLKDYFNDPKYRARAILAFYLVLFIALIVWFRSMPKSDLNTNDNKFPNTNQNENNDQIKETGPFSLITSNNFNFEYILNIDTTKITSVGKKYMAKEEFILTNNISPTKVEYYVDGLGVKGREKNEDGTSKDYIEMSKPYLYIDYFNTIMLKQIVNAAKEADSNTNLTISNKELCEIVGCPAKVDDGINTIELEFKNNYVVGIKMDYSAFSVALSPYYDSEELTTTIFELKYSNFNLIDDFNIKN